MSIVPKSQCNCVTDEFKAICPFIWKDKGGNMICGIDYPAWLNGESVSNPLKERLEQLLKKWEEKKEECSNDERLLHDKGQLSESKYYRGQYVALKDCIRDLKAILEQAKPEQ